MADIGDLFIRIFADGSQLEGGLNNAQEKLNVFEDGVKKLGRQLTEMFSVVAVEEFIRKSVDLAEESERSMAKVAQAIKQTNGIAGQSFEELKFQADEFQHSTLFTNDQVMNDVSAQLLTFTNLTGENFERAQKAALDLATVLGDGQGLRGVSIQLGKALNDPVQGLTALRRSGISFSESQVEMIKNMAESNRLAEAQSFILDIINGQYGGQAEAALKASNGMNQLHKSLEEVQKSFGNALNHTSYFSDWLDELGSKLDSWSDERVSKWNAFLVTFYGGAAQFMKQQRDWEKDNFKANKWSSEIENQGESSGGPLEPTPVKQTTYADLVAQLHTYQKALQTSTEATRDGINAQIEKVKEQIKAWENSGKAVENYKGTIKGLENEISALQAEREGMSVSDPLAVAQKTDLINQKNEELNILKNASLEWVNYGKTVENCIDEMIPKYDQLNDTVVADFTHIHDFTNNQLNAMLAKSKQVNDDITQDMRAAISSTASSLGTLIGDLINGQEAAGDSLLKFLGKIIGQVGQMAIALGSMLLAIDMSLADPLNPALAIELIGAGVIAVAIGEVFTNASKSSSAASGSTSSSSSNTFDTRATQAGLYQNQTIELVQRGRDMVASIKLNQLYYNRQG